MNARTEIPDLIGYACVETPQRSGPLTACRVKSLESGVEFTAEWIEAKRSAPEVYSHVRRQWQQNTRQQPAGSLRQRDFVESQDRLTRVTDLPGGRPIIEALFEKRFELKQVLEVALTLTRCLADWHQSGRVHGRLGGDCLYWDSDNEIQLREIAVFDGQVQPDFLSLPARDVIFYSPESSGSLARSISPASDLYAVGVLIFTMLSARPPIEATSASNYLDRQLCFEAPRLRELGLNIPRTLDDVVARLLRRDPSDRYETATGLLHDLIHVVVSIASAQAVDSFAIGTRDIRRSLTESAMVGREHEIETMQRALEDARAGTPSLRVITAAEASCRRNFVDEISLRAKAQGMHVFRGAASVGDPKPLQSLEGVLSHVRSRCENDADLARRIAEATHEHAATLSELCPALATLWPQLSEPTGPDDYGGRRAAVALESLMAALASESEGVTFLFDDFDLADDLTQTVVRSMIERVNHAEGPLSLCIVISGESMRRLGVPSSGRSIELGPVSEAALGLHLQSSAGRISDVVSRSIIDVADGNTSMASAILGRMIDLGVVTPSEQGWIAEGPLAEALRGDESIAELLERQLGALSKPACEILSSAAAIGQQFELSMLAQVTGTPYADVLKVATDALARRLLWRDSRPGWFRFAHDRIHASLRSSIDKDRRQSLHLKAAAYVEQQDPHDVFALALHYDAGGNRQQALSKSLEAARNARQKHSLSVAQDQLLISKRWVSADDRQSGLEISESLGEIQLLAGRYDDAEGYLREALDLAQTPLQKARVQQKIGELAFKRGRFADAATDYEHALAMTGIRVPSNFFSMLIGLASESFFQVIHTYLPANWIARNAPPAELDCLRLQLLSRLSHVYWFSRHKLWTLGNHLRSLNEAERFSASETLAAVYSEHGPVMSLLRWFDRANRYARRSLTIREQRGNVWGQGQSHHYHSVVMLAECRFEDSINTATRAVDLLRKMGDFWEMNMARYQAANALYRIGRSSEAAEVASQMFHCGRDIGDLQATGISLDVWARTAPHTLPLKTVAAEAAKPRPDAQSHAQTQLAFAVILLHHNRVDEAIDTLRDAIRRSEHAGHLNTYISPCYAWLGTALRRRLEDTDVRDGHRRRRRLAAASQNIRKAKRISQGFPADRSHCLRELGIIEAMRGNPRSAQRSLLKSVAAARQYTQPIEEMESLQVLRSLHQLHATLLGTMPADLSARLEDLSVSHESALTPGSDRDATSTNLSLADRFVTVLQSGRRIAQALSSDVVYSEASQAARKLLRGQFVDVVTIERAGEDFSFTPLPATADQVCQRRIQANEPLIQAAQQKGKAVCDADLVGSLASVGSAIAAPIAFRGVHVAVIVVTHDELKDLFGNDELRIADFVSTLAGAALENADGFLRLHQLNDTLEQRVLDRTQAAEARARQLAASNEQLRATEDQLREAIVHANSASEAKSRFLATISHEIRTPLNGILGMTRLARESSIDQRQANYLDTVQQSGQSLLTLINELLDLSKLESGKLELESIPWNPTELAGEISRLMAAPAWQKGVELVCDVDPALPDTLTGDPSRVRQIVMNLVGNAIKFTERGFIALIIRFVQSSDTPNQLSITVKDSGIGIPYDKQEKIFESFSQADSSTTRQYGGTGLGLAICRELTEMMGGTIGIQSEHGSGSEFTVLLPIDAGPEPTRRPTSLTGRRIAIVDPLAVSRNAILSSLSSAGSNVTALAEPGMLSTQLSSQNWDLVVFGCVGVREIARRCCERGIPCLFLLPAHSGPEIDCGERSAELRKPALPADIIEAAETLILSPQRRRGDSGSTGRVPSHNAAPAASTESTSKPHDPPTSRDDTDTPGDTNRLDSIRILVAEDGEINQEVIVGILEMRGYKVIVAGDGEEVVDKAVSESFDLCLMDVDMPRMDGLEATKCIRKNHPHHSNAAMPIIAMTAHSDDQIWERCQAAGMNAYLSKPIDPDALFATIERFTAHASDRDAQLAELHVN
jgi:signal transduction histidine kinase/CheY-like chemotaxis protein/tetratricopeptide (TPR) repeat protein